DDLNCFNYAYGNILMRWRYSCWRFASRHQAILTLDKAEQRNLRKDASAIGDQERACRHIGSAISGLWRLFSLWVGLSIHLRYPFSWRAGQALPLRTEEPTT